MKAVLITDMPTECIKCNQFAFECCHAMKREIEQENIVQCTRPKWCPLKPFLLGEELRKFRNTIKDEKTLIGFNMAVAICNKHLGENNESNSNI